MNILQSKSGFTLIEVVIALGVLAFGILGVMIMQTSSIKGNSNANMITQEVNWAADGLERILTADYAKVVDDGDRPDMSTYLDSSKYQSTWTVNNNTPLEDMATIQVDITSLQDGKQVTLQYVRANPGAF